VFKILEFGIETFGVKFQSFYCFLRLFGITESFLSIFSFFSFSLLLPCIPIDFPSSGFFIVWFCVFAHTTILSTIHTLWICHYDFLTREDPRRTGSHQRFSGPFNQRSGIFPFFLADVTHISSFYVMGMSYFDSIYLFNFWFVWVILGMPNWGFMLKILNLCSWWV